MTEQQQKIIDFFDKQPFLFTIANAIFTQWFPIKDKASIKIMKQIPDLYVDEKNMLVRRFKLINKSPHVI